MNIILMSLTISPAVLRDFSGVLIGTIEVRGIDNHGSDPAIDVLLHEAEEAIRKNVDPETIGQHPRVAPWRDAYRKFGSKPSEYRSSIENLVRRVTKGNDLPRINKLVDIYNAVSLKYLLPAGGEDLDQVKGNVVLNYAGENEAPITLLGDEKEEAPYPGEIIYKDDVGTICRRWNWREADRTKLTEDTKNAILVVEALPPVAREELKKALEELGELVGRFCGGETKREIFP